jgi:GT2 family glycosyltransferase
MRDGRNLPTALIVTYNSEVHLGACLGAVRAAGVRDIVVYDNGSTDGTEEVVRTSPVPVTYIAGGRNIGFGSAVNAASRTLRTPNDLLLLNPDCLITPEVVSELALAMSEDATLGVCAPGMRYPDGRRGISGGGRPTLLKEALAAVDAVHRLRPSLVRRLARTARRLSVLRSLTDYLDSREGHGTVEVSWASGFCLYVRGACWADVGGFDEDFFMYFEDVALCLRARELGWRVAVLTDVEALHVEGASSSSAQKAAMYRHAMWTYFRKYGSSVQRAAARFAGGPR